MAILETINVTMKTPSSTQTQETCDGIDNNCDGLIDEGDLIYEDLDEDGFGSEESKRLVRWSKATPWWATTATIKTHHIPAAQERCDGWTTTAMENRRGPRLRWFLDEDGDDYGNPESSSCMPPENYATTMRLQRSEC